MQDKEKLNNSIEVFNTKCQKVIQSQKRKIKRSLPKKKIILAFTILILLLILLYHVFNYIRRNRFLQNLDNKINPENFEVKVYEEIRSRHKEFSSNFSTICQSSLKDRIFLNGVIRKFRPKKCLEVGVAHGCSAAVILNAIKDINGAFLYSIDLSNKTFDTGEEVAHFVYNFPDLLNKWELYTLGQSWRFLEIIGKGIEFVLLDTRHTLPGEILDFLQILPFLGENAVFTLHDIDYGLRPELQNLKNSNTFLYTYIRGEKIIPDSHPFFYFHSMGAVILEKNQENYYFDYFFATCYPWQYLPGEEEFYDLVTFFRKYYDKKYINIFESAYRAHKKGMKKRRW